MDYIKTKTLHPAQTAQVIYYAKKTIRDFFSLKSLYIFGYNFLPFLGVVFNFYDFYTLLFVYLFETVILAIYCIFKIFYFRWKKVYEYIPATIAIVGIVTVMAYFIVVSVANSSDYPGFYQTIVHYPLKSPWLVFINLFYFSVQEGYLLANSLKAGVIKRIKLLLALKKPTSKNDPLFVIVLGQINSALIRSSSLLLAGLSSLFLIFPAAFLAVIIGVQDIGSFIFLYPFMFTLCFFKGLFDVLTAINEKYDLEKLKELEQ